MSNSPLATITVLSPFFSQRTQKIDTVTIHCMAGNLTVESCGNLFANPGTKASSNYGIGSDGRIALYVDESNRSWCSSNSANDNRAVTIEVANTVAAEPYPISDAAYASLINLLADICQRNGIPRLLWRGDKSLIGQVYKQNMTVHRWFAAKSCPGNWLYEHHGQIAEAVNRKLTFEETKRQEETIMDLTKLTNEECYEIVRKAQEYARTMPVSGWATEKFGLAKDHGITDGTYPQAFVTREEAAIMADRARGGQTA